MKGARIRIALLLVILALVGIITIVDLVSGINPWGLKADMEGSPVVEARSSDFLSADITQVVTDEENLYVVNGRRSVVQVYTLEGEYRYSISVYNHNNGRMQIAVHDGRVYICDKRENIYVFIDRELIKYIEDEDSDEIRQQFNWWYSDPSYQLKQGSLWFQPEQEDGFCVIHRPMWHVLCQSDVSWAIRFFLMIIAGWILYVPAFGKKNSPSNAENGNEQLTGEKI